MGQTKPNFLISNNLHVGVCAGRAVCGHVSTVAAVLSGWTCDIVRHGFEWTIEAGLALYTLRHAVIGIVEADLTFHRGHRTIGGVVT